VSGQIVLDRSPNPPTLGDILRAQSAAMPDRVAIAFEGEDISFGELRARAMRVANALASDGVWPGDRIAVLAKNSSAFFEILFGAAIAGVVIVPVNWRLASVEIAYLLGDADARLLFVDKACAELGAKAVADARSTAAMVTIEDGGTGYAAWRDAAPVRDPEVPIVPADVAIQLYTSGTTGRPKGALLSHHNLNSVRVSQPHEASWSQWTTEDICLISMPLFHVGGIGTALASIYHGAKMVIVREFSPESLFDFIERDRITKLFLVPAAMRIILDHPRAGTTDYSRIKYILYGSSPIAPTLLVEALAVFGCGFVQVYGMTETSGTIAALPPEDHRMDGGSRMRSAGKPLKGVEIVILDATGEVQPAYAVGEVAIRSEANMIGYWRLPEATAECRATDGFLCSGDVGFLDKDGYLYIHDRVKDMIITGGENVYAAEVEAVLTEHPAVADVAVVGVSDPKWGETVKAVVVLRQGSECAAEALRAWARSRLAGYKVPKSVDFVAALPKNAAGKTLRRLLRDSYVARSAGGDDVKPGI
jgi:acyl-CoA synthetase (AMP-forming)/AMP-acid ligase II